jgi:DNA repair exonuclease SbcCD ATPase subunit
MEIMGDIALVAVVIVILAVYRKMDANSRTLAQVRKYADKAREELDGVVAEKVQELKDLGIEMEVREQTAKEILRRSQGLDEGVQEKISATDAIGRRIAEYDKVLDELIQMTRRAEENLGRVREESEFVDTLAKRIRTAQQRIEEQEGRIPELVQRFQEENSEALQVLQRNIMGGVSEQAGALELSVEAAAAKTDELAHLVKASEAEHQRAADRIRMDIKNMGNELVEKVAIELAGTEKEYMLRLDEAAKRGENLETLALSKLKEHIEGKLKGLSSELSGRIDAGRTDIEKKMNSFSSYVDGIRGDAEARLKKAEAAHAEAMKQYEGKLKTRLDGLDAALSRAGESWKEKIGASEAKAGEAIREYETNLKDRLDGLEGSLYQAEKTLEEKTGALEAMTDGAVREYETKLKERLDGLEADLNQAGKSLEEKTAAFEAKTGESIREYEADMKGRLDGLEGSLRQAEKTLEEKTGTLEALAGGAVEDYAVKIEQIRAEGLRLGEDVLARCRNIAGRNEEYLKEQIEVLRGGIGQAEELGRDLAEKNKNLDAALRRFVSEYEMRITETGEAMETRIVGNLEARLADYEKDLNYRFAGVEGVFADIQNLEKSLKDTMNRIALKIREDFSAFGKDMREEQLAYKAEIDASMREIRSAMDGVDAGLTELKSRAYDNVSEKLKVFEDEFFQDLRSREQATQEKWIEWQTGMDASLDVLAKENEEKRSRLETRYTESLKNRLGEFQTKMNAQMEGWKEEFGDFQRGLQERMNFSDETLKAFRGDVEERIEQARAGAQAFLHEEITRQNTLLDKELDKFTKEYESKLKNFTNVLDEKQNSASALLDSIRSDVTVWQAEVLQKIRESEAEITNQTAGLKVSVSDTIAALQEEFTRQRNELIQNTREERAALRDELRKLESRAAGLHEEIGKKTEEALSGFETRFAQFSDAFLREKSGFETSTDEKIRAFRASLQDTREQFDALHQKLFGRIDDSAKLLSLNLAEIDRKQKNFIEQTKIFERADSLKQTLRESIDELKNDIAQNNIHRKEIQEAESQFLRIRKLGEEVSERLSRFAADKRRIDTLEEDYSRLIAMSETVKQKIQNVSEFDDEIMALQASFRTLQTLQGEVDERFDRLEKKRKIMDSTTEGVEKNHAALEDMEKKLETFRREMDLLPENIDTLVKKLEGVMAGSGKVDTALKQLSSIDTLLKDLEKRMEKMQKVREWLARMETRIGEITRTAQEHIKLLGTIVKDGAKTSTAAKKKGAPSLGAQEIVRKLARDGWAVDQIAMHTKLSRGEVELILELGPKKE